MSTGRTPASSVARLSSHGAMLAGMGATLITGATDGIGLELARQLLARGVSNLIIHARAEQRGRTVVEELTAAFPGHGITLVPADFTSLREVVGLASHLVAHDIRLSVLVNNAGIAATPQALTQDGFDAIWQVNYLAPVLLTSLLQPVLLRSARVVNVTSASHSMDYLYQFTLPTSGYLQAVTYCQSKLALIMWTYELAEALAGTGISVNAVNPGTYVDTKMVRQTGGVPQTKLADGAAPIVRLVLAQDVVGVTGCYFDRFDPCPSAPMTYDRTIRTRLKSLTNSLLHPYLRSLNHFQGRGARRPAE
jgi:NAD(P)-dependent dehydrogenase (short-subunit alcohol dehydrogenase family)